MKGKKYIKPEMEIFKFKEEDVIITSPVSPGDDNDAPGIPVDKDGNPIG